MEASPPFRQRRKMTRLGEALMEMLHAQPKPLLTNYELYRETWKIYKRDNVPYLRGDVPSKEVFRRVRALLREEGVIRHDSDYSALWRIIAKPDAASEDIICSVDPHCYVSHMSAMQRYGITNRRPEALCLTQPTPELRRQKLNAIMQDEYGAALQEFADDIERAKALSHPSSVRGRPVTFHATKFFGDHIQVKGGFSRIATIGQTFLDMLEIPDRCGGIAHILDVWVEHAPIYLEEIISRVDASDKAILKVRAGYILDECLGIDEPRVGAWLRYAQRGSSRVLNAGKPFSAAHSEKWMLSINV